MVISSSIPKTECNQSVLVLYLECIACTLKLP